MPRSDFPSPPKFTPDQIAKWADRIAEGRDEFPAELIDSDRSSLADAIRQRLRERLLRLVARAIAKQLALPEAFVTEDRPSC